MKKQVIRTILFMSVCTIWAFMLSFLFTTVLVAENSTAQKIENVTISIDLEEATIPETFEEIESKTIYKFLYNRSVVETIDKRITLQYQAASVEQVLTDIAAQAGVTFRQSGHTIAANFPFEDTTPWPDIAQEVITGRVTDAETGQPLPGVNIAVDGTTTGTTTDFEGVFELSVPDLQQTLVISFIGYISQPISVEGRTHFDIELEPIVTGLDEVVVTAFGIARERASLGYSVSQVQGEGLTQARDINVASSLSGRIAGVNASGMGTGPGASSRVIIRGAGSIDGDNQPLYVVNGMPITNDARTIGTTGGSQVDRGDGISNINPDDIESITVLKGGAAAALYGSQAANGVILITTKELF